MNTTQKVTQVTRIYNKNIKESHNREFSKILGGAIRKRSLK